MLNTLYESRDNIRAKMKEYASHGVCDIDVMRVYAEALGEVSAAILLAQDPCRCHMVSVSL